MISFFVCAFFSLFLDQETVLIAKLLTILLFTHWYQLCGWEHMYYQSITHVQDDLP